MKGKDPSTDRLKGLACWLQREVSSICGGEGGGHEGVGCGKRARDAYGRV